MNCRTIGKGKGHPITGYQWPRGVGGGGWSAPRPGHFTPGKDPVPIVQEAGWAGLGMCKKSPPPTGIRSLDCPACSQSLYWLNYPAHNTGRCAWKRTKIYAVVGMRYSLVMKVPGSVRGLYAKPSMIRPRHLHYERLSHSIYFRPFSRFLCVIYKVRPKSF
jgi:hypothetical protein